MSGKGISKTTSFYDINFNTEFADKNEIKKSRIPRSHTDIDQLKNTYNQTPDVNTFVEKFYDTKPQDVGKTSNMLNRIDGTIGSPEFHPSIMKRKRSLPYNV